MDWTVKIEGMTGFKDHGYTFIAQQPIINIGGTAVLQDARSAQLSSYANEDSLGGKGILVQDIRVRGLLSRTVIGMSIQSGSCHAGGRAGMRLVIPTEYKAIE